MIFKEKPYPDEKEGTHYILWSDTMGYDKGTVVILNFNDDSSCPSFSFPDGCSYYVSWANIASLNAGYSEEVDLSVSDISIQIK